MVVLLFQLLALVCCGCARSGKEQRRRERGLGSDCVCSGGAEKQVETFSLEGRREGLSVEFLGKMGRFRKDFCNQLTARKGDWVLLLALIGLFAGIEYGLEPNMWFMTPQDYATVMYPFGGNSVPSWTVPLIGLIPMALVLISAAFPRMLGSLKARELHDLLYAILANIAIIAVITSGLKVAVGRPRPDFLDR